LATRARETGRVIERDGLAIFGLGTAAELKLSGGLSDPAALERAVADLGSIVPFAGEHDLAQVGPTWGEDQAPVPIALGALAFDRRADGVLVVPELTVVSSPNRPALAIVVASAARVGSILTTITHAKLEATSFHGELAPPDEFRLASARPHHDFLRRVAAALVEIASGRLDKVVLAREVTVHANRPFRQADLVSRLRALHPSCTTFAIDGFIGASPELLISRRGAHIASKPLAGTAPRSGDPDSDRRAEAALLSSAKERSEHRVVVETIAAGLSPVAEHLEVPEEPLIFELRNVSHLGTLMTGTLARRDGAYPTSLDLVGLLHPTPAVAGTPADLALDYLSKLEEIDRDRYAGPLGWVDARGDGEWHLGIRSAIVSASSARLFAGVGIVADSDPASELAETQLKLQAFLAAAVRP
jgi:menaquinone-specific isochorismate synthase